MKNSILVIDEVDMMIEEESYFIDEHDIKGLWDMKGARVFGFSTKYSSALDKLSETLIGFPNLVHAGRKCLNEVDGKDV